MSIKNALDIASSNLTLFDSFVKLKSVLDKDEYKQVSVSVSGGSDSDVIMDMVMRSGVKAKFVFFDTGLEYTATRNHLDDLEKKYGVVIDRIKAIKPIPMSIREYGSPFLSKYVSEMISRLQRHDFDFTLGNTLTCEEALVLYPNCKTAVRWFFNDHPNLLKEDGSIKSISSFNIGRNKGLRDFLISNPPTFKISNKCCDWAKKKPAVKYLKNNDVDLNIVGVRRDEGGIRSVAYKTCHDVKDGVGNLRPIYWYSDADKEEYNKLFDITNSDCYTKYGLKRTGCCGCPFGREFENELEVIKEHEPKFYQAVNKVFKNTYDYTRAYREFKERM